MPYTPKSEKEREKRRKNLEAHMHEIRIAVRATIRNILATPLSRSLIEYCNDDLNAQRFEIIIKPANVEIRLIPMAGRK